MRRALVMAAVAACPVMIHASRAVQDDGWSVPAEFRTMKNPLPVSAEVLAAGKQLYDKSCQRCHGDTGVGDGPATKFIKPAPKDLTAAQAQSDGELFYKITEGRKPMPPMKTTLSEEQRWQVVHFVRTLRK